MPPSPRSNTALCDFGVLLTRRQVLGAGFASVLPAPARVPPRSRVDAVIYIWLDGGPSAQETFDPRPDAPIGFRGMLGVIRSRFGDPPVSSALPRMAAQMRHITLFRAVSHPHHLHHAACRAHLTDPRTNHSTALGAAAAGGSGHTVLGPTNYGCGYGAICPGGVKLREERRSLSREPVHIRELYGSTEFGSRCLSARRLVERGEKFVTVVQSGWDTHCDAADTISGWLAPALDQGLSGLLIDLRQRGLLERTLVVVTGEFGRAPRLNALGGRDHSPSAGFALMAGGGTPGGQVIGAVDPVSGEPVDCPASPQQIAATILTRLGVPGRDGLALHF